MKVVCSSCGTEYNVDLTKINGEKAWFKCRKCSESIIIEKSQDETANLDIFYPAQDSAAEDIIGDTFGQDPASDHDASLTFGAGDKAAPPEKNESTAHKAPSAQTESLLSTKTYMFGLTAKVIFLMLLVSLLPGGLYFAISSKASLERILDETRKTGIMVSRHTASQVDEWVDKNVRVLKAAANLENIRSMEGDLQEETLKAIQKEYPWIYLAFTTDINGLNVARSDGKPLKNYSDRMYVKRITQGSKLAWQTLIGKTSKKPALVLAVPIIEGGRTIGLIAAAMTRNAISERVTNLKLGKTGSSFLVDEKGNTVAHKNNAFVVQQKNMNTHPLIRGAKSGNQTGIEFTDANSRIAIGFTAKTDLGWTVAIQQNKEESLAPLTEARNWVMALLGTTLAVVLLIALLASRSIVNPIKELTDAANRISVGDMDVEITTRPKNEIGDLAAAITRLQDSIRISISRLQRIKR